MMRDSTRLFDIIISTVLLIGLMPVFLLIAVFIKTGSKGSLIYRQQRVGLCGKDFWMFKFRTMYVNAEHKGLLTIGTRDTRITNTGFFLRRYKLDELPQLYNVLKGDMSIVGPRPEVRKYVNLYTQEQAKVLTVKPGITDEASIKYKNENDLLTKSPNPEQMYIKVIMPIKIQLNKNYIDNKSVSLYFKTIWNTVFSIVKGADNST